MDRVGSFFQVPGSDMPRGQHVHSDRQTEKDIQHDARQSVGGSDCRQGVRGCETPDHDQIGRVEEHLQHVGEHQRHGKEHDLAEQRSAGHVYLIFTSGSHKNS